MDLGEFLLVFIGLMFLFAFCKGVYNIAITPHTPDYVYDCRVSCNSLKNVANRECDSFDIQACFSDCLELMTE